MLRKLADHRDERSLARLLRKKRFAFFQSLLSRLERPVHILDVGSFDFVFSNSVIEHVGNHQDQLRMAREVCRVGKRYFIQTPNRYFPLEPHFLPLGIRVWLMQNFNLGWFPKTPDRQQAREIVDGIRLLGKEDFRSLFPNAMIYEEKVLGITKSFVAYGGWNEEHGNPRQAFMREV